MKTNKTFFTPVVDATPSDFLFTTKKAAMEFAEKMFNGKEFDYLRKSAAFKTFARAVKSDLIYTVTYTVKE